MPEQLKITLVKSMNGRLKSHQLCVRGLGLKRMHQTVTVEDTSANRGMAKKAHYLLKVESI